MYPSSANLRPMSSLSPVCVSGHVSPADDVSCPPTTTDATACTPLLTESYAAPAVLVCHCALDLRSPTPPVSLRSLTSPPAFLPHALVTAAPRVPHQPTRTIDLLPEHDTLPHSLISRQSAVQPSSVRIDCVPCGHSFERHFFRRVPFQAGERHLSPALRKPAQVGSPTTTPRHTTAATSSTHQIIRQVCLDSWSFDARHRPSPVLNQGIYTSRQHHSSSTHILSSTSITHPAI